VISDICKTVSIARMNPGRSYLRNQNENYAFIL